MEYKSRRQLRDIAPLLERLDRGESLTAEEQAELDAIRRLDGRYWKGELPRAISKLTDLESLDLEYTQVHDLTPLSGLTALESLDLSGTQVSDVTPLIGLTALESLDLSETQVSDLTALSGLTALKSLDLRETQVRELTPLSNVIALDSLVLCDTNISDLIPLRNLATLEFLDLGFTQVIELTPLIGLKNLNYLDLSYTLVKDLTPLNGLERLEWLILSGCNLREIPVTLYKCVQKISFDYSGNDGIDLHNATLSTQPISIFHESDEVIRAYYDAPKRTVRESKVIFLGDGGAGKTHTIKRILNKGEDGGIGTDATLGISINQYPAVGKNGAFSINFWDFGG